MAAQRIRIACPGCCEALRIRTQDLGKKAECRYCGHRFVLGDRGTLNRVSSGTRSLHSAIAQASQHGPVRVVSGFDGSSDDDALRSRWDDGTDPTSDELAEGLGAASLRSGSSVVIAALVPYAGQDVSGEATLDGRQHAVDILAPPPSADVAKRLDPAIRDSDESERLRREVQDLRSELERSRAEIARLRRSNEALRIFRARCDKLQAERTIIMRETVQLQNRLVESQVSLVGVEAEIEESRAERGAWEEERAIHRSVERTARSLLLKVKKLRSRYNETCQERDAARWQVETLAEQVETLRQRAARLSAYLDDAEAERRDADQRHLAEIDRLSAALIALRGEV
jgi:hypothetical protein